MLIPCSGFHVRKLAATEAMRYAMNGVLVERQADGKPRLVATNGRFLGMVTWTEADAAEFPALEGVNPAPGKPFREILPTADLDGFSKAPRCARHKPILGNVALDETTANGTVTLALTDLETVKRASVQSIDGEFPTFDGVNGVMPKGMPRASALLSVGLLRTLLEAAEKSTGKSAVRLSIFEENCTGPVRVESVSTSEDTETNVQFLGAIMPISDPEREAEIAARKDAAKAKAEARDLAKAQKAAA